MTNSEDTFQSIFNQPAAIRVQSPGRINLIGEHIDYLGGCVLPIAIEKHITMLAAPTNCDDIRIYSPVGASDPLSISLSNFMPRTAPGEKWLNYIIGVLAGYREAGFTIPAFEATISSGIPSGAGLSSSAALEMVTALTIETLAGRSLNRQERVILCQQAEHQFAGVPCGIMDQLAVSEGIAGHALMIDCHDLSFKQIEIPAGLVIIVTDTKVKHSLGDGEYRKRREDCEQAIEILKIESFLDANMNLLEDNRGVLGDRLFRRARHAISEMSRVKKFATALETSDFGKMRTLMRASHDSLRDDFEVSCPELDILVDAAYDFGPDRGLIGSRMTGGGFGGSTISLVREESANDLQEHLKSAFKNSLGREIEPFITEAADGARILTITS